MRAASLGFLYRESKEPTLAWAVDGRVSVATPRARRRWTEEGGDGCCNGREGEDEAVAAVRRVVPDEEGFGFCFFLLLFF
jgi:hypothetical protein